MRRFKSAAHVQRFVSVHGVVQNLFRVGRHLLRSTHHRVLRTRAFVEWDAVTLLDIWIQDVSGAVANRNRLASYYRINLPARLATLACELRGTLTFLTIRLRFHA